MKPCNGFPAALLRHPKLLVPPGLCYGRTELALAPDWQDWVAGRSADLRALAPACVWSSPSSRCATVAASLATRLEVPFFVDERLLELDFGDWEGLAWDDVPRGLLDCWAADPARFRPPGGESGASLIERVASFSRLLIREARSCVVVSHGGPLRLLPALLREKPVNLLAPAPALGAMRIIHAARSRFP